MKKITPKQMLISSVFWGSLWGIAEATIGHLTHFILFLPGFSGFIMFPIGFYFMTRVYRDTGKAGTIFNSAIIAASIKLLDLLLPGMGPIKTINPAICIIMEAIAVCIAFKIFNKKILDFRLSHLLVISAGWRLFYLYYSSILFILSISNEFIRMGVENIIRFSLLEPLINSLIILLYLNYKKKFQRKSNRSFQFKPLFSTGTLIIAILIKLIPLVFPLGY